MTDEHIEPDIRHIWRLRRGSDSTKGPRFTLDAEVHGLFVEPTRDEVRIALMQILDESLGADPDHELASWAPRQQNGEMVEGNWVDTPVGQDELEHLRRWKAEAMEILEQVDRCHALLPPGYQAELGTSKVDAVFRYLHATVD